MEQKKPIGFGFRGWMLILYQAIAYITYQVFTQYPLNILADFYGGATKVSSIYSTCAIVGIVIQLLLIGPLSRMKSIKAFGSILGAISIVLAYFVMSQPVGTLWTACYAIINVTSVLYATLALGILVGQWFPTRKGTVMGIATLAFPIANGLLGPFANSVFAPVMMGGAPNIFGAFMPFFIISIIGWLIGLIFVKDYPEQVGAFRDNDKNMTAEVANAIMLEEIENKKSSVWTLGKMLSCRDFWFGTLTIAGTLSCAIGLMSQSNAIISACPGLDYTTVMLCIAVFGCIGSFVLGLIDTRFGTKKAMAISTIFMILAGILGMIPGSTTLFLAMICVAVFMGASSNFGVSMSAQYWRREDFGRIFTLASPIGSLISSASPVVVAMLLFGETGYKGHTALFTFVLVVGIILFVLMLLFKPSHIAELDNKYRAEAGKPVDDALAGRK